MTSQKVRAWSIALTLALWISGCASRSEYGYIPYNDMDSNASPAAYGADGMMFRKRMPLRPNPRPWEFYYKHCAVGGVPHFPSQIAYNCSSPY